MLNDLPCICAVIRTSLLEKANGDQLAWIWIYRVRRLEKTPSLASLSEWEKKRFSATNQKRELPRLFGAGPLKTCPQGTKGSSRF